MCDPSDCISSALRFFVLTCIADELQRRRQKRLKKKRDEKRREKKAEVKFPQSGTSKVETCTPSHYIE